MGINISVVPLGKGIEENADHPDWDWIRHTGDAAFWDYLTGCETEDDGILYEWKQGKDGEIYHRPRDITACRAWVLETYPAPEMAGTQRRLLQLLDILEREPQYWMYVT